MSLIKLFGDDARSKGLVDVISKQPPDCFLFIGGEMIGVHRTILVASSKYFEKVLTHPKDSVQRDYVISMLEFSDVASLKLLVAMMYSKRVQVSGNDVTPLINLANKLQIALDNVPLPLPSKKTVPAFLKVKTLQIVRQEPMQIFRRDPSQVCFAETPKVPITARRAITEPRSSISFRRITTDEASVISPKKKENLSSLANVTPTSSMKTRRQSQVVPVTPKQSSFGRRYSRNSKYFE